jgi:hypothetical protein
MKHRLFTNVQPQEYISLGTSLWWIVCLIANDNNALFSSSIVFKAMSNIASQPYWAVFFVVLTLLQLYTILSEKKGNLLKIGVWATCFTWCFVAGMFLVSYDLSPGITFYFLLGISQMYRLQYGTK